MQKRTREEERLLELYLNFLEKYQSQDPDKFREIIPLLHPKISAVGSGLHEIVDSKDVMVKWGLAEKAEVQTDVECEYLWHYVRIFENTGVIWSQMNIKIPIEGIIQELQNIRLSATFSKVKDQWQIVHTHTSLPYSEQNEDEIVPMEALKARNRELERLISERTADLKIEKEKTESLLYNILPIKVAKELLLTGKTTPSRFKNVTVLFSDFENFTQIVSAIKTDELVNELNEIFGEFDDIMKGLGVEKIKTVGDAYLAVGGLPTETTDHAEKCIMAAKKMKTFLEKRQDHHTIKWRARIGIHTGPITAGVVGKNKFAYDVFGDTVNTASRMETASKVGKINISASTYHLVKKKFPCTYRGKINVKGKGDLDMYFVD